MAKSYIAHVISHSHWDREWYLTFEEFRIRLVDLIDNLLDILDNDKDFRAFMFDGQTIMLEDYLEIKPQNEERLTNYIREGRILIGPWYILPDEILISGESHIRNYLLGDRLCKRFGAKMEVGYLPDAFGHPSQMPQILKKLGMDEILFWRGLGNNIQKNEFIWESPDGTEILGINLPFGYGNAANLPADPDKFISRISYIAERTLPTSTTNVIPVMNGRDHLEAQKHIPDVIKKADAKCETIQIIHSTLPDMVRDIKSKLPAELERHKGELRSGEKTLLLGGTISTRMYLKQANHVAQNLYEKWVEPFAVLASLYSGSRYPEELIRHGWKQILQNHPHDSICGCSIDKVHDEMEMRYEKAVQIGNTLVSRSLESIADAYSDKTESDEVWCLVFNPLERKRTEIADCTIDFYPRLVSRLNYERLRREYYEDTMKDKPLPTSVKVYDAYGNEMPAVLRKASIEEDLRLSTEVQPHVYKYHRCHISFEAKDIPALGYKAFKIIPVFGEENDKVRNIESKPEKAVIENKFYKIEYDDESASINIYDKVNGVWYNKCNMFVDGADAGDEYTYSPVENDRLVYIDNETVTVEITNNDSVRKTICIKGNMNIPECMTDDEKNRSEKTVACPISTEITIYENIARIDFRTVFENHADDHRLRVLFPAGFTTGYSWSEGIFSVDKRDLNKAQSENCIEKFTTNPQKGFVSIDDGMRGLTLSNKGLPEYEVYKDESGCVIALTLVRCVGVLSKDVMLTRTGDAGWQRPTPGAQCKRTLAFEYSLIPHKGSWYDSGSHIVSQQFNNPVKVVQLKDGCVPSKIESSFLSVNSDYLMLSAIKKCEYDDGFILRFYNSSDNKLNEEVKLDIEPKKAWKTDLKEDIMEECVVNGNSVHISANPWEIVSIKIVF